MCGLWVSDRMHESRDWLVHCMRIEMLIAGQMMDRHVTGWHNCLLLHRMVTGMHSGRRQQAVAHVLQQQCVRMMHRLLLWHVMMRMRLVQRLMLRLVTER